MNNQSMAFIVALFSTLTTSGVFAKPLEANPTPDANYEVKGDVSIAVVTAAKTGITGIIQSLANQFPNTTVLYEDTTASTGWVGFLNDTHNMLITQTPLSDEQRLAFAGKHGQKPIEIAIARTALVAATHPDHPAKHISDTELNALFSTELACGGLLNVATWQDLGLPKGWSATIAIVGPTPQDSLYSLYQQRVLCGGADALPGTPTPTDGVAAALNDRNMLVLTDYIVAERYGLNMLAVNDGDEAFITPTFESISNNHYPLTTTWYLYVPSPLTGFYSQATAAMLVTLLESNQQLWLNDALIQSSKSEREKGCGELRLSCEIIRDRYQKSVIATLYPTPEPVAPPVSTDKKK